jgi:hypothetical protein
LTFRLHMQVLVYPNVQRLAHSHGPAQAVDYPEQCCRLLMKSPALVTAGRLPVEYDHYDFIYVPRGGGHVRRVRMLFQLFRSWVWLLWLLRLAKLAQSSHALVYGIGQRDRLSHLRRENRSVAVASGHPLASLLIRSK